jgi:hypothetical protein
MKVEVNILIISPSCLFKKKISNLFFTRHSSIKLRRMPIHKQQHYGGNKYSLYFMIVYIELEFLNHVSIRPELCQVVPQVIRKNQHVG